MVSTILLSIRFDQQHCKSFFKGRFFPKKDVAGDKISAYFELLELLYIRRSHSALKILKKVQFRKLPTLISDGPGTIPRIGFSGTSNFSKKYVITSIWLIPCIPENSISGT